MKSQQNLELPFKHRRSAKSALNAAMLEITRLAAFPLNSPPPARPPVGYPKSHTVLPGRG